MSIKIENIVYRASQRDEILANFESVSFSTQMAITLTTELLGALAIAIVARTWPGMARCAFADAPLHQ